MNAILILLSLVCIMLAIRGVLTEPLEGSRFDSFFFINLVLAAAFAYLPVKQQMLEAHMEKAVEKLLVMQDVEVYCQSFWDTFYNRLGVAGFVYRGSHKIILEPRTCDGMAGYLDNPGSPSDAELFSLHVLTHEAMHVGGEYNEIKTDCMAFQRNHVTARLLGVGEAAAVRSAIHLHQWRSPRHPYYSEECEPGSSLDEKLPGAVWQRSGG